MLPGMPGFGVPGDLPIFVPVPPGFDPAPSPPPELPDLASPGFWCYVLLEQKYQKGFVQTAINADPDHVPKPPEKGLPGTWVTIASSKTVVAMHAWVPTPAAPPDGGTPPPDGGTPPDGGHKKAKHG
jgi:hypothetical protein